MPKLTTAADATRLRFVIVTMDSHLSTATQRARQRLAKEMPGVTLEIHAADEWGSNPTALDSCLEAIEHGDIIVVTMLFLEDHFQPLLAALQARRNTERFAAERSVELITVETLYDAKAHYSR